MPNTFASRVVQMALNTDTIIRIWMTADSINWGLSSGDFSTLEFTVLDDPTNPINESAEYAYQIYDPSTEDWFEISNGRFFGESIVYNESNDPKLVTISCINKVKFLLSKATLSDDENWEFEDEEPGSRTFPASQAPGMIINYGLSHNIAKGGLIGMSQSFNSQHDSNYEPWNRNEWGGLTQPLGTTVLSILDSFAGSSLMSVSTTRSTLNIFNGKIGGLKPNVVVGRKADNRPVRKSTAARATNVMVQSEDGNVYDIPIPGADVSRGRLEMVLNGGGVNDRGTAKTLAYQAMVNATDTQRSYQITENLAVSTSLPFFDYNCGDTVSVYADGQTMQKRIEEIQIRRDAKGNNFVDITLEYLFYDTVSRIIKAIDTTPKIGNTKGTTPSLPSATDVATYGTVLGSPIYSDAGFVRVLLDGFNEWTSTMEFRKLISYDPVAGDRVWLAPAKSPEIYIVAGKLSGLQIAPPIGEPPPGDKYQINFPSLYGMPYILESGGWILSASGNISVGDNGSLVLNQWARPVVETDPAMANSGGSGRFARFRPDGRVKGQLINLTDIFYNNTFLPENSLNEINGNAYSVKDKDGMVYAGFAPSAFQPANEFGYTGGYWNIPIARFAQSGIKNLMVLPPSHRPSEDVKIYSPAPANAKPDNWVMKDGTYKILSRAMHTSEGSTGSGEIHSTGNVIFPAASCTLNWIRVALDPSGGYRHGNYSPEDYYQGPLEYAVNSFGMVWWRGGAFGGLENKAVARVDEAISPRYRQNFVLGTIDSDGVLTASPIPGKPLVCYYKIMVPQEAHLPIDD